METISNKRFWEIDFLRAIAIILMIVFHFIYDLDYFDVYDININSGFWFYIGRLAAIIFILLVGISLTLSYSKAQKETSESKLVLKYLKRGIKIFLWGVVITVMTWVFLEDGVIVFGILHFIGVSIVLAYPFIKRRYISLFLGILCILFGLYLQTVRFNFTWALFLGFRPDSFYTLDYFPIFPWFGVILIGLFFGNLLYPNYTRRFKIPDLSRFSIIRFFCYLGRHSLFIYLIHQPVLIVFLYFFGVDITT